MELVPRTHHPETHIRVVFVLSSAVRSVFHAVVFNARVQTIRICPPRRSARSKVALYLATPSPCPRTLASHARIISNSGVSVLSVAVHAPHSSDRIRHPVSPTSVLIAPLFDALWSSTSLTESVALVDAWPGTWVIRRSVPCSEPSSPLGSFTTWTWDEVDTRLSASNERPRGYSGASLEESHRVNGT